MQITYDDTIKNITNTNGSNQTNIRNGIITGTEVRMRNGAGVNTEILGYFEKGERVTVLEIQEKWTKVERTNGQIGWVSNDFLSNN